MAWREGRVQGSGGGKKGNVVAGLLSWLDQPAVCQHVTQCSIFRWTRTVEMNTSWPRIALNYELRSCLMWWVGAGGRNGRAAEIAGDLAGPGVE